VDDWLEEAHLVEPDLREGVLGDIFGGKAEHQREVDAPESDALPELAVFHLIFVEVALRGVHDQVRQEDIVHLGHRLPSGVFPYLPFLEVLEVIVVAGSNHG
jgi:hypothetical protein